MKNTKIIITIIIFIAGFLVLLLNAKIIIMISNLYRLDFITKFSFLQVYGILLIFSLLKYKYKKPKEEDFFESVKLYVGSLLSNILISFFYLGLAYFAYYVISIN